MLYAYNPMYFDRNISENKVGKKNEGSYLSCVMNCELYFSNLILVKRTGLLNSYEDLTESLS